MKILIVHQYYLFPGQPGGSRFNEMARLWSDAGHDVTVVTGTVNYTTGESPERYRGHWVTRDRDGDVTVWRCHVPASYSRSYAGRMWSFFAFSLSAATAAFLADRPDVVIATSPPLVVVLPAWVASRLRGRCPWIFEIRDLWPESAITTGVIAAKSLLARLLFAVERWACKSASRINVLTPAFREDIVRRGLTPAEKVVFVPNGADVAAFRPAPRDNDFRRASGWGDATVFLYAGAHGRANSIGQLVDAAERLNDRRDIVIATVGDGPERIKWQEEATRRGLANIMFLGPQPKERMPEIVNACDVGLAVLQRNPTFKTVYPNKVFDYMSCERPAIVAIDGVARALVCDEAQAGLFAEPDSPDALASAITELADDPAARQAMGRNGRAWVLAHATRDSLAARYLSILGELTERRTFAAGPKGPALHQAQTDVSRWG